MYSGYGRICADGRRDLTVEAKNSGPDGAGRGDLLQKRRERLAVQRKQQSGSDGYHGGIFWRGCGGVSARERPMRRIGNAGGYGKIQTDQDGKR